MVYPESWKCPNCRHIVKNNKMCTNCKFKYSLHYPELWSCPECGELISNSKICPKCNYPNELHYPYLWHCPECNNLVHSSTSCSKCGYEAADEKSSENKIKLEKKLRKYFTILKERKNIVLISAGIITLLGLLLLFSIPALPENYITKDFAKAGENFNLYVNTNPNAESVTLSLTNPTSGEVTEYSAEKNGKTSWIVRNLMLNESGEWSAIVKIKTFSATTDLIDTLNVQSICEENDDCSDNKVCCNGACITSCISNNDCDDSLTPTIDVCNNPKTCNYYCTHEEPSCSFNSDDYCPVNCNRENDIDCTNCPNNQVLCSNACYETCYINNDCDDNNISTQDSCVKSINPCNSYCTNTPYSEINCSSGKIRVGSECVVPACMTEDDCYDNRDNYAYKCYNGGTINAYCYYQPCLAGQIMCKIDGLNACVYPACDNNNDCDKGEAGVFYYCKNHGTCDAYCTEI